MNKKQLFALLLVGLLVTPTVATAAVRGSPELSVIVPDNSFAPGEQANLQLQIQNTGNVEVGSSNAQLISQVTTARGVTAEIDTEKSPISTNINKVALGSIPDGSAATAEVQLTIPDRVPEGTYKIPITVNYQYTYQISETTQAYSNRETSETFMVEIRVEDRPRFRVLNTSSDVLVGGDGEVSMQMVNIGSEPATDATVSLESSSPDLVFGQSSTATRFIGEWAPGEEKTVTFDTAATADASTSSYALTANVAYEDVDGVPSQSNKLSVGVTPLPEQSFDLSAVETDLRVGAEGRVSGTVTNLGPETANDAVLVFQSSSPNYNVQETEYALGSLEPNESSDFRFDIDVSESADPGSRQLSYYVSYQNGDGDDRKSKTLNTRAEIAEQRDEFTLSTSDATVDIGSSGIVTVELTNNGDETLTNINAKAYASDPLSLSDDEAFIESLEPGESTEIKFQTSVAGSALEKDYPLSVDFQYERPNGDTEISQSYKFPVTAASPDGGSGLSLPIIGIGALLVIGGAVVIYRRR
ncbi:sialidase [Haloferax sp. Atlit-6N]|uniref:COG1361 S-layer family protein n=1 Tax=Haloferax sp. Atlit-6N TaxID=2077205 RepID=UPI000E24772C|nr:COG1361 S-layer family protein [Haloferax sp. Atlit-6N]REA02049.1 sialidase [Haloferax sp. Atlit-6N]